MKRAFDSNDKKIIRMRNVISRTEKEEIDLFTNFLKDVIKEKTGKSETINKIASICSLKSNNLTRFPIQSHKYLAKICTTYKLSLDEAIELYSRSGLCLSYLDPDDKEYLDSVLSDYKTAPKKVNIQNKTDCLLKLIKNHDYSDTKETDYSGFKVKLRSVQNEINLNGNSLDKNQLFSKIIEIIGEEMKFYSWVMISGNDCLNNKSRRYTAFEIAFACHFDKKETKELYRSFGYALAPKYIKFDSFVSWLLDLELTNEYDERYHFYKTVSSNIDQVTKGAFQFCEPSTESLDKLLEQEKYEISDIKDIVRDI